MSAFPEKTEELIGAYLDGELSQSERLEVERQIATDPQVAKLADQLRTMRVALQSAPKRRLPNDFAQRVILAAQQEAKAMGSNGPSWILDGVKSPSVRLPEQLGTSSTAIGVSSKNELSKPLRDEESSGWRWAALLAFAATGLFAAFLGWSQFDKPQMQGLASIPRVSNVDSTGSSSPTRIDDSVSDSNSQLAQNKDSSVENKANATSEQTGIVVDPSSRMAVDSSVNQPKANDIGKAELNNAELIGDKPSTTEVAANELAVSDDKKSMEIDPTLNISTENMMFVVDVSVSPSADEEEVLRKTFERFNIAYELPLEIGKDLHESLEKNRMVGPIAPIGGTAGEEVAIVFVKARASRLDAAIAEICSLYDEFPEMSYDMVMNPPAPEALKMLRSIREFDEFDVSSPDQNGLARGLKSRDGSFVAPPRRVPMAMEVRQQMAGVVKPQSAAMDPSAYCLFVIRKPGSK